MVLTDALKKVLNDELLTREEVDSLADCPLSDLSHAANEIRHHFLGNQFDLCTIVNAKCGHCSENCRFCAQSAHWSIAGETWPLLSTDDLLEAAKKDEAAGSPRFSLVTSGRRLSSKEVAAAAEALKVIRQETDLSLCGSFGLLGTKDFEVLADAGLERVHCNLEASQNYFPHLCTTHSWQEKVDTLKAARQVGLDVCSGGLFGTGESLTDRLDLAFELRELGVASVPLNRLVPIQGTPLESQSPVSYEEFLRTVALFRFVLPKAFLRLAGGRGSMPEAGKAAFEGGANATISGNMLTTSGYDLATDKKMLDALGYEVVR